MGVRNPLPTMPTICKLDWDLIWVIELSWQNNNWKSEIESKPWSKSTTYKTQSGTLTFNFSFSRTSALGVDNLLQHFEQIPNQEVVFLASKTC